MTEQQITDEILRYIDDKSYNYAVLIDGDWGSGKTYFAKHALTEKIEEKEKKAQKPRAVKYISLYGCKTVNDIQENIAWNFAENARDIISNKARWDKKANTIAGNVVNTSRKIGNIILKKYLPEASIYEIASEWLDIGAFILIVDDLERCDCPINETFGFFNELVEHENTKVIFLANEKEIIGIAKPDNIALQYLLSINDKVDWPEEGPVDAILLPKGKTEDNKISIDEMESRRNELFPQKEANEKYRSIREKLIGEILKYEPDIKDIMKKLIDKSECTVEDKDILLEDIEYYYNTMHNYKHLNLRSYQFFLSKIIYLFNKLQGVNDIQQEYLKSIKKSIIEDTFLYAVIFKSNYKPEKKGWEIWSNDDSENISFIGAVIKQFVENGCFVFDEFQNSILALQDHLKIAILEDDPYNLLNHEYYIHTQDWCENELDKLLKKLVDNKYPITMYVNIIDLLQRLINIGFDNSYMDKAKKSMIDNISSMKELDHISADFLVVDDKDSEKAILKHVDDINLAIENHSEKVSSETIQEVLEGEKWVGKLKDYVNSINYRYVKDMPFFSKATPQQWIKAIESASPDTINDFRDIVSMIYPKDNIREAYQEDANTIKEIFNYLSKYTDEDLIKKMQIDWLKDQFEDIIDDHELVYICSSEDTDSQEDAS